MDNYEERKFIDEEATINAAFQELLDIYLASQHRKKVELITKAFNFARQDTRVSVVIAASHISCTPSQLHA